MKVKLIFIMAVMLLTGCNGSNNTAEETTEITTLAQSSQKDSILGAAEENYIDYNAVCANIVIDGEAYSMPFTYDDISKNYDCTEARKGSSEGYFVASLENSEGKKLAVEIKDTETNGENLNDKPITAITVNAFINDTEGNYYYDDLEEKAADISFNGVRVGMSLEGVQKAWGVADMYQEQGTKGTAHTYMSGDQKMTVQVMTDFDNKVYSITLVNHRL